MLVYPSVCENESELVLLQDYAGILDYWRAGIGVCIGNHAPPAPLGSLIVAWIRPKVSGAFRQPARIFYLSCFGPPDYLDGIDHPARGDFGTLVAPASVTAGKPQCEPPKQFGRRSARGHFEYRLEWLLGDYRKQWQRYAEAHGFSLPLDHREVWDGDKIPF